MSAKFQITIPNDLLAEMKSAASREGVPLAEFIRESVRERLEKQQSERPKKSFWEAINGMVDSEETDLSMRVDEILYGGDPHD